MDEGASTGGPGDAGDKAGEMAGVLLCIEESYIQ
jgi:hypothetical protein